MGVKLLGRQPDKYFFGLLVWEACHVVGTTCNRRSLRNRFGSMERYKPPNISMAESWWRSRRARPLEAQRICILWDLNLGLILPNDTWKVIYFSCALQCKVTGKSLRSKIFNSQVSYKKKMCMFYSSSWIIFLKFKRQAI